MVPTVTTPSLHVCRPSQAKARDSKRNEGQSNALERFINRKLSVTTRQRARVQQAVSNPGLEQFQAAAVKRFECPLNLAYSLGRAALLC